MTQMTSRRNFVKWLGLGLTAAVADQLTPRPLYGFVRELTKQDKPTFEKELFTNMRSLGYRNPLLDEANLKHNLENATNPMNPKPTPLALIVNLAAEQPTFRTRLPSEPEMIKVAVAFEKKTTDVHTSTAIALVGTIQQPPADLNTPTPIKQESWIAYGLIQKHLSCLSYSCDLFDGNLHGGNTAIVSNAIKTNIEKIRLDNRFQLVSLNTQLWLNTPRSEAYRSSRALNPEHLTGEQKRVKQKIEKYIETNENTFPILKLDMAKIIRIVFFESSFDPQALNPTTPASGLFQIMPGTWEMLQTNQRFQQAFRNMGLNPNSYRFADYRFDEDINTVFGLVLYAVDGDRHWLASQHNWG